mmetsp:Transcript_31587/g.72606  ORF Transcript_31587/g.72606 Transcript_31587/m.72606 type:complete len:302 (-) Transcript_31587:1442-2347(-)
MRFSRAFFASFSIRLISFADGRKNLSVVLFTSEAVNIESLGIHSSSGSSSSTSSTGSLIHESRSRSSGTGTFFCARTATGLSSSDSTVCSSVNSDRASDGARPPSRRRMAPTQQARSCTSTYTLLVNLSTVASTWLYCAVNSSSSSSSSSCVTATAASGTTSGAAATTGAGAVVASRTSDSPADGWLRGSKSNKSIVGGAGGFVARSPPPSRSPTAGSPGTSGLGVPLTGAGPVLVGSSPEPRGILPYWPRSCTYTLSRLCMYTACTCSGKDDTRVLASDLRSRAGSSTSSANSPTSHAAA